MAWKDCAQTQLILLVIHIWGIGRMLRQTMGGCEEAPQLLQPHFFPFRSYYTPS